MPTEPLPLDTSRETMMFRALVRVLQADETLQRVVRTWQVADGDAADEKPLTEVTLPGIRLLPDVVSIRLAAVEDYDQALVVAIDFAVQGTNADDRMNLWAAIRQALPSGNAVSLGDLPDGTSTSADTVREYFREAGAHSFFFQSPGKLIAPPQPNQPMTNQYCRAVYYMGAFAPG